MNGHCPKRIRFSAESPINNTEDEGVQDIDMKMSWPSIKYESDFEECERSDSGLPVDNSWNNAKDAKVPPVELKEPSKLEQKELEECGREEIQSIPKDFEFRLQDILNILLQEFITCQEICICKISQKRARGPIKEILGHRWHGGKLFLLCKHHSLRAYPEYLQPCQVNCELRKQYARYLKAHQKLPPGKEKWTKDSESVIRNFLCPSLDAEQTRIQEEISMYLTTVDWVTQSQHGKIRLTKNDVDVHEVGLCPGPVLVTKEQEFYEVERIIGAKLHDGETLFFVKWRGYPDTDSTWEPRSSLQMSWDVTDQFQHKYGKPNATRPSVFSTEGLRIEKLQQRATRRKL
ncbi:hypothetical protein RvY_10833 [Ramazzottius varieornatus]|uniref:Chromo domain-containing protein n=1 Tax=Ramazzottius varieornatus TaxID=947166 RepID=A0A1D1VJH2_RAMVA|nr:hypothetical protein RvY_10833 [Ramazzottius varieornatus]